MLQFILNCITWKNKNRRFYGIFFFTSILQSQAIYWNYNLMLWTTSRKLIHMWSNFTVQIRELCRICETVSARKNI